MRTSAEDTGLDITVSKPGKTKLPSSGNFDLVLMNRKTESDAEIGVPDMHHFPETDLSHGIVGWDGQDDPKNPQNFSSGHKWGLLGLMAGITFVSPLASSMLAPAMGYVGADFGTTNETLQSFTVSIYLLGYAVGISLALLDF
jgi:hypothetical protein